MDRKHTNASVNRAGDFFATKDPALLELFDSNFAEWEKKFDEAFEIMADWRTLHAFPLKAISAILGIEALAVEGSDPPSERLKRFRSISSKLRRYPVTNLTTMQDIAGCRVVARDVRSAYQLSKRLLDRLRANSDGPQIVEKWSKDYIADPKPDGYRSIHHVAKFFSANLGLSHCNGLRIEIQIRSRMQHAWAMALETASAVTNQGLKSGQGEDAWKRFFFLVAEIIAATEGTPNSLVGNAEHTAARREAADLARQLRVINLLSNMQHVLEDYSTFEGGGSKPDFYLLVLDSQKREIAYVGYTKEDFKQAVADYSEREREHKDEEDVHVVLVSVESLNDLKNAYPSFFLDSAGFIDLIREQVFSS